MRRFRLVPVPRAPACIITFASFSGLPRHARQMAVRIHSPAIGMPTGERGDNPAGL